MKFQNYINEKNILDKPTWIGILFGIFSMGGIFGFIYETIFYYINNGALTRRGTCFGPWIEIYGFGGLLIFAVAYKFRKKPWAVFLLSGGACGLLEYITGYLLYLFSGTRSWDYDTEIWNFGNIGGFVCLRSVLFFAVSGMFLIYALVPVLIWLQQRLGQRVFLIITLTLGILFFADFLYNDVLAKRISAPSATEFYGESGWYPIVTGYHGKPDIYR